MRKALTAPATPGVRPWRALRAEAPAAKGSAARTLAPYDASLAWAALVVSRPFCEVWKVAPVCMSMKQPVP